MRDIGANIRRARVRRKLTQDDLAQTVHTTRQTISNYETGRSRPDVETLQRLADALSVELTELLDGAPSADARRAALRRVCIMGAVTLILAGLWAYLHAVCLRQYQRGDMAPLAAMLITEPLLLCALAFPSDWSCFPVLCTLHIDANRGNLKKQVLGMLAYLSMYVLVWCLCIDVVYGLLQFGVVLVWPLMHFYNGTRGKMPGGKWFFYFFYAGHLFLCGLLRLLLHG